MLTNSESKATLISGENVKQRTPIPFKMEMQKRRQSLFIRFSILSEEGGQASPHPHLRRHWRSWGCEFKFKLQLLFIIEPWYLLFIISPSVYSKMRIVKPLLQKTERMKRGGICSGLSRLLSTLSTQRIVAILLARLSIVLWNEEFEGSGKHLR